MIQIGYRMAERFSPTWGESWVNYIEWSGFVHLTEIVGLDCLLSPAVPDALLDEDWNHVVFGDHLLKCFGDLAYLLHRSASTYDASRHQVLALAREPVEHDLERVHLPGFRFMGFELVDEEDEISALTNCGGFDGAFDRSDISASGLIVSLSRAYAVREALATLFPDHAHSECAVWAVWRLQTA